MIESELVNVTDLVISRPVRQGPSRDQSAAPTTIASSLQAILEEEDREVVGADGTSRPITGTLFVNPVDNDGDAIHVRPGDLVTYSDYTGATLKPRRIVRVRAHYSCTPGVLDHLELEFT